MKTLELRRGERLTIRAIATPSESGERDRCAVLAFFEEQALRDNDEFAKLAALLTYTARNGPPRNEARFKHLSGTDGVFEFKTPGGLRIFCFWDDGNLIICTHGFLKKSQKTPKSEIERAEKLKREYFWAKENGELINGN